MPDKNAKPNGSNKSTNKRLLRKPRLSQRPHPSTGVTNGPNDEAAGDEQFTFVDSSLDYEFIHHDDEQQPAIDLFSDNVRTPRTGDKKTHKSKSSKSDFEKKFILDPIAALPLVKPRVPRGPPNFPPRRMHRMGNLLYDLLWDEEEDSTYFSVPAFTLNDFLHHVALNGKVPIASVKNSVLSRHNYKKLTKLMAEENARTMDNTLKMVDFEDQLSSIPTVPNRVPNRHILLEMAAMVKEQINEALHTEVSAIIKPLPKYSSPYFPGEGPLTEIVIYESCSASPTKSVTFNENQLHRQSHSVADSLLQGATPRYFQGAGRSQSPFANNDATDLSQAEVCLLESLAKGGYALSLKAQFISTLPDINPVSVTLTYINLSFNDFKTFPLEVLSCRQLMVLKMRNNPLRELPEDIKLLFNLRTFVTSFCLLSSVPASLFSLRNLSHLDLSYNRLSFLPDEIRNARCLAELNLEGNAFYAMPCGALKLQRLRSLRVKNNFMHPLFWREATKNEPQRLVDIAAVAVHESGIVNDLDLQPDADCQSILEDFTPCDCCGQHCYGPGIRIIRPCTKIFGVKNLPFLFRSCGPSCASNFVNNPDMFTGIIYG